MIAPIRIIHRILIPVVDALRPQLHQEDALNVLRRAVDEDPRLLATLLEHRLGLRQPRPALLDAGELRAARGGAGSQDEWQQCRSEALESCLAHAALLQRF